MRLISTSLYASLALVAVVLLGTGVGSVELEQVPTSHPTMFFVAPTVPEESEEQSVVSFTNKPTQHPTPAVSSSSSGSGTGLSYKDDISEENQTAVNTSSYMFYTFIGLIAFVAGGYYFKRYTI